MIKWKPAYDTGVPKIDRQHRVLLANFNRLEELLASQEVERAEADCLLQFLEQYATLHFRGEETCMTNYRCPACDRSQVEHTQFLKMVKAARAEFATTTAPTVVLERLHESMVCWFNDHILRLDSQLKERA